jgi:hypothetical protein
VRVYRICTILILTICVLGPAAAQGASWELASPILPGIATEGTLRGVSCASASACTAVGDYFNRSIWGAFGNEWNGAWWKLAEVIANPGEKNGDLWSVSCISTTRCVAAGAYGSSGKGNTLIESSNSGAWSHVTSPNPSGTSPELLGIDCKSVSYCISTGHHLNLEGNGGAIAEEWGGTSWTLMTPLENPGNRRNGVLWDVSCLEVGMCMAVGGWGYEHYANVWQHAGSEMWNATTKKWVSAEAEQPGFGEFGTLYSVSCKSATFCMAVGSWSNINGSGPFQAMADIWNGTKWSNSLATGGPPYTTGSVLHGVSCITINECEAVGSYTSSEGTEETLAYLWKESKWTLQTTPNPPGATASALASISCPGAEDCTAVGGFIYLAGALMPVIEHF